MDLQFSEEQQLIQQQAREFMEKQCSLERVRELWDSEDGIDDGLWKEMAELGWMGMLLPEEYGGLALSVTDVSRVLEEMGRGLLPGPFLGHMLGSEALLYSGSAEQRSEWLPKLASGEHKVALVRLGEGGRNDAQGGNVRAESAGDGFRLTGGKLTVPGAAQAQTLVVAAQMEGGVTWFLADADTAGLRITPVRTMEEGIKQAAVHFDGVEISAAGHLSGGSGERALERVGHLCDVALTFDALGGSEQAMTMAVEYAKIRQAFNQPIGSFQAIKHKCADMLYGVESLRAIALWAAWVLDHPDADEAATPRLATAMARTTAIETYDLAVRYATQVQGGIATTQEHPMHMFAKRSRILALSFGPIAHYQEIVLQENGFAALTAAG